MQCCIVSIVDVGFDALGEEVSAQHRSACDQRPFMLKELQPYPTRPTSEGLGDETRTSAFGSNEQSCPLALSLASCLLPPRASFECF